MKHREKEPAIPCGESSSATQKGYGTSAREARSLARSEARSAAAEICDAQRCGGSNCRYLETSLTTDCGPEDDNGEFECTATSSGLCSCEGAATTGAAAGNCTGSVTATEVGNGNTARDARAEARQGAFVAAREACQGKTCAEGACSFRHTSIQVLETTQILDDDGGVLFWEAKVRVSGRCECPGT